VGFLCIYQQMQRVLTLDYAGINKMHTLSADDE